VACVGRDMIKVWPLPVEQPWGEDPTSQLAGWLESIEPAATVPVGPAPMRGKEAMRLEVRFKGNRDQAVRALAGLKADWYLFVRQSAVALFGIERETTGPITDTEMRQLLPTLGSVSCGRQLKSGQMLTVTIPIAHTERLMSYWNAIKAHLEADGWLEESQGAIREESSPPALSTEHEQQVTIQRRDSLERQLAELRENLRLTEECKAEYVQATDIPLQLIKDERRTRQQIAELEDQLNRMK
jgi:hypothetical protein